MSRKKGITVFATIAALLVSSIAYASIDYSFFEKNTIVFYDPSARLDAVCTPVGVAGSGDSSGSATFALPEATLKQLTEGGWREKAEKNKYAYLAGEEATGVPWTVLAALHYREASMDPTRSLANGETLHGGHSIDGQPIGTNLKADAIIAAQKFIEKAKMVYEKNTIPDTTKTEDWANAYLAYNRGFMYRNWNRTFLESPYVMNGYDTSHMNMKWIDADSYNKPGGRKYNDLAGKTDGRPGALAMLAFLGGPVSGIQCKESSAISGNILETAKLFAIDKPIGNTTGGWKQQAKPEFVAALEKFNPGPAKWGLDAGFADCGVFVATVMRASGVDPEFPASGTSYHERHLRNSGKYQIIENPKESDLLPGDILIHDKNGSGHIGFYAGDLGNGLWFIDASMRKRPPSYRDKYAVTSMLGNSRTFAARFIKQGGM